MNYKYKLTSLKTRLKRVMKPNSVLPIIGDKPYVGPSNSTITFVMIVRRGFNINKPNANMTCRLGFCNGFRQNGIGYRLVSVWEIEKTLPKLQNPIIFLSVYDYLDMSNKSRKMLRNFKHFVWGNPDVEVMKKIYLKYNFKYQGFGSEIYNLVLESEPQFIFTISPPSAIKFFSKWNKLGLKVKSIPLACDTSFYYQLPEEGNKYEDVQMAFVGGYWPKKAIQFDKYLMPYEDILTVYGYSKWPYRGYKGNLSRENEKYLYKKATISPAISEPHAEVMGDIVERAFKIMGSGGLAITDVVPFYRELFNPEELLVPENIDEYHYMVKKVLTDKDFNKKYREAGYKAIKDRHTYAHRARTILKYLDIDYSKEK